MIYKAIHGLSPSYLSDLLLMNPHSGERTYTLRTQSHTTNYGKRAFQIYAPSLWNSVPFSIRSSETILVFKNNLKTFLFLKSHNDNSSI